MTKPDGLLCTLNKVVFRETVEAVRTFSQPKSTQPAPRLSGGLKQVELAELVRG